MPALPAAAEACLKKTLALCKINPRLALSNSDDGYVFFDSSKNKFLINMARAQPPLVLEVEHEYQVVDLLANRIDMRELILHSLQRNQKDSFTTFVDFARAGSDIMHAGGLTVWEDARYHER